MSGLLAVKELSVSYGQTLAVDRVSFSINKGEIFALVGESGSGKSSIGLALTQLLPSPPAVVSGQVLLNNQDVLALRGEAIRKIRGSQISYIFQEPASALNPVLSIGEQLMEVASVDKSIEWLNRVGIESAQNRLAAYPHEFSGGMQQRACIAMALAANPMLLVADEPTTALDVTIQVQILRLIRDLQKELGLSVLLITHDLLIVERLAHRVGILSKGKLVEQGAVAEVFNSPKHAYTQELLKNRLRLGNHP